MAALLSGVSGVILTMRTRSFARTDTCARRRPACFTPVRWRMRQHDRRHDGDQQDHRRELERQQILA